MLLRRLAAGSYFDFLFGVAFNPVGNLCQAADPVLGFAGAGELVILSTEVAQPGGDPTVHQSGVHLHTLRHGAPVIFIRVNE